MSNIVAQPDGGAPRHDVPTGGRSGFVLIDGRQDLEALLAPVREAAPLLECPVLVLRGASRDVLSEEGAEEVTDLIRGARLEIVEKAGHLAAGDNPHSTLRLIRSFFDELTW